MQRPNSFRTLMFHPTIDWWNQVSLQPITLVPYSKQEFGFSYKKSFKIKPRLIEAKPPQPSMSDSTSWSNITNHHQIGLYPNCPRLQSFFSNQGSKTSNSAHSCFWSPQCLSNQGSRTSKSTHSCCWAPECLPTQGSKTSNSTHEGLQRICPTKTPGLITQAKLLHGSKVFFQPRLQEPITQPIAKGT